MDVTNCQWKLEITMTSRSTTTSDNENDDSDGVDGHAMVMPQFQIDKSVYKMSGAHTKTETKAGKLCSNASFRPHKDDEK